MDVAWALFWGKPGAGKLAFFRVKWLRPAIKDTSCASCVRRVRLRSNRARSVPPLCSATSGCSCVRSSMRFLTLWLQIAVQRLHDCCRFVLPCASRDAGFQPEVAKRIVMAAWMLHGLRFGGKPGQETLWFSVKSGSGRRWKVPRVRGGCGLGSAKAGSSPHCNGCFDVFCLFLHIAVTLCFGIFACKTHCNGRMIVVICVAMCVERCGFGTWFCAPQWSHAGHVLGQQQRNKLARSKHVRRTARASSIDEKGLIIKSKATSAPPRAGTTGMIFCNHAVKSQRHDDDEWSWLCNQY